MRPELLQTFDELVACYPEGKEKSAILPILHLVQKENDGYLSVAVMDEVAAYLKIQPIEVYEVATFYTMFKLKPTGKYVLEVCQTGPCCLVGADGIIAHLQNTLGIGMNETSADGLFTLRGVECLAACGTAPVMQVGDYYCENLTPATTDALLTEMRDGTFFARMERENGD